MLLILAGIGALFSPARAAERLVQRLDERAGLHVSETCLLEQDSRGFIWIGTIGGLVRFDGTEMRAWAPVEIRHVLRVLSAGPNGEVLAAGESEPLWRVTPEGVEAILGPSGAPIVGWKFACLARDGALWVAESDTLRCRAPSGGWSAWPASRFDASGLYRVQPTLGDSIYVGTRDALYLFARERAPRRLAPIPNAWQVAHQEDGTPVVLSASGGLWRLLPNGPEPLAVGHRRGAALAVRGNDVWAQLDGVIWRFSPSRPPEQIAPTAQLDTGRALLVDRERTLWIGSLRGVLTLPEPNTSALNAVDGLPPPADAHHLERSGNSVWVVCWAGTVRVDLGANRTITRLPSSSGRVRADERGRVWAVESERGFLRYDGAKETHFPVAGLHGMYGSARRPDGSLWAATDDGLFILPLDARPPRRITSAPPLAWGQGWDESWLEAVLEDHRGRLWVSRRDHLWSCNADSLARGENVTWRAWPIPDADLGSELLEPVDGEIWLATTNAGVWRFRGENWEPIPGNDQLHSLRVYGMRSARSGGVWILTAGTLVRVEPHPELAAGWTIVERLSTWQGLPTQQASDIVEDQGGTLWLATVAGLVEVPPEARHAPMPAPAVELVEVRVDGVPLPTDRDIRLPWRRNRLELRFAALTYRDRERLRYQARLRPDAAWQESDEPTFRFVDLSPGHYLAVVRASLDGEHWSEMPRALRFSVARPWWQEAWAVALFVALAAAALYGAHRLRVAVLLRLERQRLRIAMDLHDEVGSGLGSIGILAGLASDRHIDEAERASLAARIAETASELGAALGDIVRSLREASETSESFARRLAASARRLVPDGRLVLALPARWPDRTFTAEAQRELRAVAIEAIHNAVKHAHASRIELGMAIGESEWQLWVEDDGRGLDYARSSSGRGYGLVNLRARCRSIGATVSWTQPVGGGTRMEVRFRPDARRSSHGHARARAARFRRCSRHETSHEFEEPRAGGRGRGRSALSRESRHAARTRRRLHAHGEL
ncbi:MAG: histidine kinase [Candidatus Eisenbacteria bacterium]